MTGQTSCWAQGRWLDAETARICILAGAQYVVSPSVNLQTIEMCHRYSIAVLPGALTPTEVVAAWQAGADVVKIFPAFAMGGAKYLTALKGPLPHIHMIPTGGVTIANAADFLNAGAFALGVGSDLVDAKALAAGKPEIITQNARKYLTIVADFQAGAVQQNPVECPNTGYNCGTPSDPTVDLPISRHHQVNPS